MKRSAVVLTSSGDVTSDYLCERLGDANMAVQRLDTDRLTERFTLHCDSEKSTLADENGGSSD